MGMHHVIIIGGGFGGLYAATALKKAPVEVTLIDRRNFHLFQPLLYQVATGGLSPANIAAPLRSVLRNQKNTKVILGEVIDIDAANKKITLTDKALPYDTLIVATGSHHHYFGHPEWMGKAPGLKTIEDALEMRKRILLAYEQAEKETDESKRKAHLTFVVIGGGPTGVELAGALADIARQILKKDFRAIHVKEIRIILVEGLDRVLLTYPKELSEKTRQTLVSMGVEVHTGCFVTDIQDEYITVSSKKSTQTIPTRTVLWAAGVQASSLGKTLAQKTGISTDKQGRIFVEPDLSLKNHPEIFVIGDLAHARDETGNPLPGVAPVAMQQGKYVAELIKQGVQAHGHKPTPFHYHDKGSMATIGKAKAVVDFKGLHFSGFFAWLIWLFVHLMYILQFGNKILVLTQWIWNYFTPSRSARLITGKTEKDENH